MKKKLAAIIMTIVLVFSFAASVYAGPGGGSTPPVDPPLGPPTRPLGSSIYDDCQ